MMKLNMMFPVTFKVWVASFLNENFAIYISFTVLRFLAEIYLTMELCLTAEKLYTCSSVRGMEEY